MSTKSIPYIQIPRSTRIYNDREFIRANERPRNSGNINRTVSRYEGEQIRRPVRRPDSDYSRRPAERSEYRQNTRRPQRPVSPAHSEIRRHPVQKKKNPALRKSTLFLALELFVLMIVVTVAFNMATKNEAISQIPLAPFETEKTPKWMQKAASIEMPSWIDVQIINSEQEGNPSRTCQPLEGINDIVVHYVGNPRTTAQQNRDYYNIPESDVCSHFVVGLDGEIINCVPLTEKSASSNDRNRDTISIEVCHPDVTGEFTDESYQSLIKLVNWLMAEFDLDKSHVIRHYEVTGKECPMYYVRNPEAWEQFKNDLTEPEKK